MYPFLYLNFFCRTASFQQFHSFRRWRTVATTPMIAAAAAAIIATIAIAFFN